MHTNVDAWMWLATGALRTPKQSVHRKLTMGKKSLATQRNQKTCPSISIAFADLAFLVQSPTNWPIAPAPCIHVYNMWICKTPRPNHYVSGKGSRKGSQASGSPAPSGSGSEAGSVHSGSPPGSLQAHSGSGSPGKMFPVATVAPGVCL